MPVIAWDDPEPQKVGLIELFLLGISPKAKAFTSWCHWKVPRSLLPNPLCLVGPMPNKSQDKSVAALGLGLPLPSPLVCSLCIGSLKGRGRADGWCGGGGWVDFLPASL